MSGQQAKLDFFQQLEFKSNQFGQSHKIQNRMSRFCLESCLRSGDQNSQVQFFQFHDYKTKTGTLFCILIPIICFAVFFNIIIGTFQKRMIASVSNVLNLDKPGEIVVEANNQFAYAIMVSGINQNDGKRFCDLVVEQKNLSEGGVNRTIKLQPCSTLVPFFKQYQDLTEAKKVQPILRNGLCFPIGTRLFIQGSRLGEKFSYVKISIKACTENKILFPNTSCASKAEFQNFLTKNKQLTLDFYFINTLLNPSQQNFIDLYLQQSNYFNFNQINAISANLYFSDYSITTDTSILPWSFEETKTGYIVQQPAEQRLDFGSSQYFKLYLRRSPISRQYKRSFQKLDVTLAYIGGLFGPIILFLNKIISLYNTSCYLLQYADRDLPDKQKLVEKFNFFSCISLYFLKLPRTLGCSQPPVNEFHQKILKAEDELNKILKPGPSQKKVTTAAQVSNSDSTLPQMSDQIQRAGVSNVPPQNSQRVQEISQQRQAATQQLQNRQNQQRNMSQKQPSSRKVKINSSKDRYDTKYPLGRKDQQNEQTMHVRLCYETLQVQP